MKQIDPVISAYFAKIGSRGGKVMSEAKRKANQQRAKLPRKKDAVYYQQPPPETVRKMAESQWGNEMNK